MFFALQVVAHDTCASNKCDVKNVCITTDAGNLSYYHKIIKSYKLGESLVLTTNISYAKIHNTVNNHFRLIYQSSFQNVDFVGTHRTANIWQNNSKIKPNSSIIYSNQGKK